MNPLLQPDVQQVTVKPVITQTIAPGNLIVLHALLAALVAP
jgi:hypothetical protein